MNVNGVSAVLLCFGVTNIVGTTFAGIVIDRGLRTTLMTTPLLMAVLALGLATIGDMGWVAAILVSAWGLAFGVVPVS